MRSEIWLVRMEPMCSQNMMPQWTRGDVHTFPTDKIHHRPMSAHSAWGWSEMEGLGYFSYLSHWGRVTHICVSKLTIIGSDNGLSPGRRQAIIWTNAGLLSIGPWRTYFSENLIKIQQFSLKKMHVKMSSAKWRSSCLGLNVMSSWPSDAILWRQHIV